MDSQGEKIRSSILELLRKTAVISRQLSKDNETIGVQPLLSDGSSRRFFRVFYHDRPFCIAVFPGVTDIHGNAESKAAAAVGIHLHKAGVPVPAVMAFDQQSGLLIFEDLGDERLHDYLRRNPNQARKFYPHVVKTLAHMQVRGADEFDTAWCFDTPAYDQKVMLEKESGYFYRAFWQDTLFGETVPGLDEEFNRFAETTAHFFEPLFLHRDFQSRNIMIKDEQPRIIDFQAGRLGPPAYDLASLLIDPYVALSDRQQAELLAIYLDELQAISLVDVAKTRTSYPYLAVQRNLQIVGAFAFLSGKKKKSFFRPFILPALISLHNRLALPMFDGYPVIRKTVSESLLKFRSYNKE